MSARVAEVAEAAHAQAAAEAAPALEAAPLAEIAADAAPLAEIAAETARATPTRRQGPHPDPHPEPRPNPKPDPRPEPAPGAIEVLANTQQSLSGGKTIFLGDVTLRGRLDPVKVNLKVNGAPAEAWFQPGDLREGVIQRLEVTDQRVTIDGKVVVNVVMNGAPQ
jgi:hypothetical protein